MPETLPMYTNKKGEEVSQEDISSFLDAVRESGKINMFGAVPYVEDSFDLSKKDARAATVYWMENFGK